jgi:hypothetical protein
MPLAGGFTASSARQVFHESTKIARVDVVNAIKSRHQRADS